MANAQIVKEVLFETENRVGMLVEITGALSDNKINIKHISAYVKGKKAQFTLITDNNEKTYQALRSKGYVASEKEVVVLRLSDKVGALKKASDKIKAAGIDIEYIYGTTCAGTCDCQLVISSNDNRKLADLLE